MLTVTRLLPQGRGLATTLIRHAPTLDLDWDMRQKSRQQATDSVGRTLNIFLTPGSVLRGGDVLVAEDGSQILVVAAPQVVLRIKPCAEHGCDLDLARAAYHLGNRHVPVELHSDYLQIEPDPVLADMLRSMHLVVTELMTAFEPEGGAYGGGHGTGRHGAHSHMHGHGHDHTHHHG